MAEGGWTLGRRMGRLNVGAGRSGYGPRALGALHAPARRRRATAVCGAASYRPS